MIFRGGVVILAETRLADGRRLTLREAGRGDAAGIHQIISEAFGARPPVEPPAAALSETEESVAASLDGGQGLLAEVDGEPAGAVILVAEESSAWITRVSVRPCFQRLGVASAMLEVGLELLAENGVVVVDLIARAEFPAVLAWWRRHGFTEVGVDGPRVHLRRQVPIRLEAPTATAMQHLGEGLASRLRAGDLLIAAGDLGAGKTTLTQGIGAGLGVRGAVISPTFVISRVHPGNDGGPPLVHVDAYRLGSWAELEDIDLEVSLADSVTVVEWGTGVAEALSPERLEIDIRRSLDPADETRWVFLTPIGARWESARQALEALS